jgi:uncharacterized membrane protein
MVFKFIPPKSINFFYGYRTNKSMLSKENWIKGNKLSSKILFLGSIMCSVFSIILYFFFGAKKETLLIEIVSFVFVLLFTVIYTETKLKD